MKDISNSASIFVKVDNYKEVSEIVNHLKDKVDEIRSTLQKVEELREKESDALHHWRTAIDDVDDKINNLSNDLLEPQAH